MSHPHMNINTFYKNVNRELGRLTRKFRNLKIGETPNPEHVKHILHRAVCNVLGDDHKSTLNEMTMEDVAYALRELRLHISRNPGFCAEEKAFLVTIRNALVEHCAPF